MTRTAVYRHYDATGALLYVGVSSAPRKRMAQHRRLAAWASEVTWSEVEWFDNRADALAEERRSIAHESPRYNQANCGGCATPLGRYLSKNRLTHEEIASRFGVSRAHLTKLVSRKAYPSRRLMILIDRETRGEVPAASWFSTPPEAPE